MLSLLRRKFLRFSSCKISITLLIFPKCRGLTYAIPNAKLKKSCLNITKDGLYYWRHDEDFFIESLHHCRSYIGDVTCEKSRYFGCRVSYSIINVSSHDSMMRQCRDKRVAGVLRCYTLDAERFAYVLDVI